MTSRFWTLLGLGFSTVVAIVVVAVIWRNGSADSPGSMSSADVPVHDHSSEIAYYTCPMHPSVKLHDPDAPCPICGMDLAAVPAGGADRKEHNAPGFVELSPFQQQLIGIQTEEIVESEVSSSLTTIGRVTVDETRLTDVNLKVSGWIRDLYVDYTGKRVKQGQPLFTLYSPELVTSQEEYLLAYNGLQKLKGATNQEAESDQGIVWNERLLASARERLQLWDLTPQQIQALETSGKRETALTVYAPSDGIVMERMAVSGMYVRPDMRLYRIARLDTLWILADVYESDLGSIEVGQEAKITLAYLPDKVFRGRVDYVYPYLNAKSRTATVRVRVGNPNGELKPDMYADVDLQGTRQPRLVVPDAAVLFSGKRRIVFTVVGEGRFSPREVRLGQRFGSGYEVLSGIAAGDRVVTRANFLLDSESKLKNVVAHMHQH